MSHTLTRIAFLVLALAGGVWVVWESGANPTGADAQDIRPARSVPVAFQVSGVLQRQALWNGRHVKEGEELGEQTESMVAITNGVSPGDTVVVQGQFALGHSARIRVEPEGEEL